MSNFKPPDSKREEFRKYLERAGVMDALTKVLVSLYEEPEKPEDALEYIRQNLGGITDVDVEVEMLKKELEEAKAKIIELKAKLVKYEPDEGAE
ncbi:c-Myc-binding protein isoform X2 [Osmia lignaria lignaria]|uniref:c-Myc-binding protein isoform X2 n=1 Tax=Osmia bicornis bicornis TaxID=1437191 RepID=UPI0010F627F8|nr:c-Myc-binding protein isoform X2 [Osmia bicornis bicornis]XP_034172283.1 c-Myc-binding protein isoform X2 [Osmia lignaria]